MIDAMEWPEGPVDPEKFTEKVLSLFHSWGSVVADDLPEVVRQICGILNLSIINPRMGVLSDKRVWIVPAQTGIGKSVCIQVYVSMLQDEGALIVLPRKDEVREYAETINDYVGNDHFACCAYSYQNKSDEHEYLVKDPEEWQNYRCLIVTHNKYINFSSHDERSLDHCRFYKNSEGDSEPREVIIIDEKLKLYDRKCVTLDHLSDLITFLQRAITYPLNDSSITQLQQLVEQLRVIHDYLVAVSFEEDKPTIDIDPFYIRESLLGQELAEEVQYGLIYEVIQERITAFLNDMQLVVGKTPDLTRAINGTIENAKQLANRLESIIIEKPGESEFFYKDFSLYKDRGELQLFRVANLSQRLGTCVVFDATAVVNKYYEHAERGMFSNLHLFDIPQIREYSNLTIHKAMGQNQSKSALGIGERIATGTTLKESLDYYASVATSILQPDDRLLIITYKEFKEKLKDKLKNTTGVYYTHWGKHVGSNEWKDCNKVMIIGWNHLPRIETISRIYGTGIGTGDINVSRLLTNGVVNDFAKSQVVDDLVQGAMRCRARVIDTPDADCQSAELYLFYPDNPAGHGVIGLFEQQFPNADVRDWEPVVVAPIKKGPVERNGDLVLQVIDRSARVAESELWKVICEEAGLSSGKANRLKDNEYFNEELSNRGYTVTTDSSDSRSYRINFR